MEEPTVVSIYWTQDETSVAETALYGKGWTEGRTEAETMNSAAQSPGLEY